MRVGKTIEEILNAPPRPVTPPIALEPSDLVLHVQLGGYRTTNMIINPAVHLSILRKIRRLEPTTRVIIVCEKPMGEAEENYLRFYEEFHPIFQHGSELEDFATLYAAKRIIATNSAFSWCAAYMGKAEQRWIPTGFNKISETDVFYNAVGGYDLAQLNIPRELAAVSGEFFQGMCQYTIINREKKREMHKWIDVAVPPGRQLYIEKEWPEETIRTTKSLFVYVDPGLIDVVAARGPWPALRLLVFHNGDYVVNYDVLIPFLEKHPNVYALIQNNIVAHPRIRTLPIMEQNRIWRGGSVDWDPPVTISRAKDRENDILFTWFSNTNKIRCEWLQELYPLRGELPHVDLYRARLPRDEFVDLLTTYKMVVCPPGNGRDTHRHWETIMNGAWAIVHNNEHTARLLADYPSLPLIPIESIKDLTTLAIPREIPSPFHPMVLRPFWKTLFDSYVRDFV